MDYIVGLTEQELEFFYNKSEGLSNYSELDEMERMELVMNTNDYIRNVMLKVAKSSEGNYQAKPTGGVYIGRWMKLQGGLPVERLRKKSKNLSGGKNIRWKKGG